VTPKQRAFVDEYLQCWNASEAARRAGYSERTAGIIGHENLKKPKIAAEIQQRIEERAMAADEVLQRLADQARGDAADFLDIDENVAIIDIGKMAAAGKTHLIKKYRVSKDGISVELYDAQAALVHIGRHHGLFVDRKEITGKDGGPLLVVNWDDPNNTD
jgi:phage terminase small subunit